MQLDRFYFFLGRQTVKCVAKKIEKEMIHNALDELKGGMKDPKNILPFINITGQMGTGKTTILRWTFQEAKRLGYR